MKTQILRTNPDNPGSGFSGGKAWNSVSESPVVLILKGVWETMLRDARGRDGERPLLSPLSSLVPGLEQSARQDHISSFLSRDYVPSRELRAETLFAASRLVMEQIFSFLFLRMDGKQQTTIPGRGRATR